VQVWDLAKPDETLRQKDPVTDKALENPNRDTDGVTSRWLSSERTMRAYRNHKGRISQVQLQRRMDVFRAPF